jgi:predicted dehydrogenase
MNVGSGLVESKVTKEAAPAIAALRAGIAGAGLMGRWHAHAVKRVGGAVAAVMDIDLQTARRLASKYPGAKSFFNFEQMLNRGEINVLHVCTPASTHYALAEQAIEAGLHLIIEKPLTPSAADTESLYDQAAYRGVLLCPVHQFVFQDGIRNAKALLPRIGRLVHLEGTFCSAGGTGLPRAQLDAIVADILPHPLSLMQVFLPTGLGEHDWVTLRPVHGELRVHGEVSGISLSIFISMNARPTECSFKIFGTDGAIHLDLFHGFAFMEPGKVSRARKITHPYDLAFRRGLAASVNLGKRFLRREPAYPGLRRLISSFYQAVQTNAVPPLASKDTITIARIRERLIERAGLELNIRK